MADFSPDRHIRAWRVTVLLSSLGFFGLLGYVIIQVVSATPLSCCCITALTLNLTRTPVALVVLAGEGGA